MCFPYRCQEWMKMVYCHRFSHLTNPDVKARPTKAFHKQFHNGIASRSSGAMSGFNSASTQWHTIFPRYKRLTQSFYLTTTTESSTYIAAFSFFLIQVFTMDLWHNKANLRDLISATGLISNWIQINDFSAYVTVKFDGWPRKTIGHFFYSTSSFVHHFQSIR